MIHTININTKREKLPRRLKDIATNISMRK
jgi:hypothetical protein